MTIRVRLARSSSLGALALVLGFNAAPAAAWAQAANEIEEVVVTARRTAENLQEVPVAVTALSNQKIDELVINNPQDMSKLGPSLQTDPAGGQRDGFRPNVRGVGVTSGSNEAGVIPYFAEAPNFNVATYDLENIQVLKGPQGTLFGETAAGGVLLFEPKRPRNEFEGYGLVQGGNFGYRSVEGAVGGALIEDKLMVRIAGQIRQRDGFMTVYPSYRSGIGGPIDSDNVDSAEWRASVVFRPFDKVENYLMYAGNHIKSNGTAQPMWYYQPRFISAATRNTIPANNPTTAAIFQYRAGYAAPAGMTWGQLLQAAYERQTAAGQFTEFAGVNRTGQSKFNGIVDQFRWEVFDGLTFRNIFQLRWQKGQNDGTTEVDGTDLPIVDTHGSGFQAGISKDRWVGGWPNRQWTNESQLQGALFDNRLKWQGGFYYRLNKTREWQPSQGGITVFAAEQGLPIPAATCATVSVPAPCSLLGGRVKNTSYAGYGQGTFAVTDAIHLTAGYRRTWDTRISYTTGGPPTFVTVNGVAFQIAVVDTPVSPGATVTSVVIPKSAHGTYTLAADWQVNDDTLVYVTHRKGYKSGGINGNLPIGDPNRTYSPETLKDVEAGVKADWTLAGLRGRTNLAVYKYWYKNVQRTTTIPETARTITSNLADINTKGAELEATIFPTEWFELSGYLAYLSPKYPRWTETSTCAAQFARPQCAGLPTTTIVTINHSDGILTVGSASTTNFHPDLVSNASKWRWAIQPKVHLDDWTGQKVTLGANIFYRSHYSPGDQNTNLWAGVNSTPTPIGIFKSYDSTAIHVPGYTLIDLRADWKNIKDSRLSAAVSVTNATDKVYMAGYGNPIQICGCVGAVPGEPRMWYLELRYDLGG